MQLIASGDQNNVPNLALAPGSYLLELRLPFEAPEWLEQPIAVGLSAFLRNVRVDISAGGLLQITFEVR